MATHHSTGSPCPCKIPDANTLRRYVASREKIDRDIDFIMAFTNLLSQYKTCTDEDERLVDLYSLGFVNQILHDKVLDIMEALDNFIPLGDAMGAVMEEENEDP